MEGIILIINDLLNNFTFVAVVIAWFLAQAIKVVIYRFEEKKWNLWHFFEAGGMPSAHSASVTCVPAARCVCRISSIRFWLASIFSG